MDGSYQKPRVGFVLGDHAGIGPEIVLKLLQRPRLYDVCTPVLIGNFELLSRMAAKISPEFLLVPMRGEQVAELNLRQGDEHGIVVVDIAGDVSQVTLGMVNTAAGWIAYHSIVQGYHLLELGIIEGLILAPVTKEAISKCGCGYHSEYEILAACAGVDEAQTVVKGSELFRASVVGHIPFRDILKTLTYQRIMETGRELAHVIRTVSDQAPKILVAALNSCEEGTMGEEEQEMILPAIAQLRQEGLDVDGHIPADEVLNQTISTQCNGILYMYHDQGNIAMKTQMFQTTACIYINVPYPILSTGHGSALDIADLGVANPTNISFVLSVMTDMIEANRKSNAQIKGDV